MIAELNRLVESIESHLTDELDVAALALELGTTEYHLRRMFSSLAGMPLSEYIRRRRMTVAAAEVVGGDEFLQIAARYGYGSTESFGRAFEAVHGVAPRIVRRNGGPLRTQPQLRFSLTVEGNTTMDARLVDRPRFRLVGHAARVPLIHEGPNSHIQEFVASLPIETHERLKRLSDTEPHGLLQATSEVDDEYAEGTPLLYLHGVAIGEDTVIPDGLEVLDVEPGMWAVFRIQGSYPERLQEAWARTATEWFPSNPWRLRPGPSIVGVLERSADFSTATCELWLPVERA
jgi:AraC family transcriptional regulator